MSQDENTAVKMRWVCVYCGYGGDVLIVGKPPDRFVYPRFHVEYFERMNRRLIEIHNLANPKCPAILHGIRHHLKLERASCQRS